MNFEGRLFWESFPALHGVKWYFRLGCFCYLVDKSCLTLCDPVDYSPIGSSVHGIPRQEYWSGFPFPSPGDPPDPRIEPMSPALADGFFTTESPGKSLRLGYPHIKTCLTDTATRWVMINRYCGPKACYFSLNQNPKCFFTCHCHGLNNFIILFLFWYLLKI